MENEEQNDTKIINYRLTNIESTLAELKTVIVENKLQEKEIQDIKGKLVECLQAFNAHDKRIRNLEIEPVKNKADKWQTISDMVFKWVIGAAIGFAAIKFGISA
jgi:hypothetical protein